MKRHLVVGWLFLLVKVIKVYFFTYFTRHNFIYGKGLWSWTGWMVLFGGYWQLALEGPEGLHDDMSGASEGFGIPYI